MADVQMHGLAIAPHEPSGLQTRRALPVYVSSHAVLVTVTGDEDVAWMGHDA